MLKSIGRIKCIRSCQILIFSRDRRLTAQPTNWLRSLLSWRKRVHFRNLCRRSRSGWFDSCERIHAVVTTRRTTWARHGLCLSLDGSAWTAESWSSHLVCHHTVTGWRLSKSTHGESAELKNCPIQCQCDCQLTVCTITASGNFVAKPNLDPGKPHSAAH